MTESRALSEVVGQNARAHRTKGEATLDDVARAARFYGLKWNTGRVGDLESGRIPATLPTLFVLAEVLGDVTGERITIADLVWTDGWVEINPELTVKGETLAKSLQGEPVHLRAGDVHGAVDRMKEQVPKLLAELKELPEYLNKTEITALERAERNSGVTEERVAKDLGISLLRMHHESAHLWGDSFSRERDRRAGANANAQRKGQITRRMKEELRVSMRRGDGQ
ncbi:hypothetical protein [Rhodococcus sp. GA1]|uniref:hypothetical protein n=1 Tax=Rhodococcus sp. GA1 TaxID=2942275 RepID=UPI0020CE7DA6|nr:hypothetical protein [Rhodococcus sp. GA1]